MRRIALVIAAGSTLVLGGCAWLGGLGATETAATEPMPGQLEAIHAAAFTSDQAVFWVSSNGCTDKDDLKPIVSRKGGGSTITLRRLIEDRCDRPLAEGVELIWSFEELGLARGAKVSVNNPYLMPQAS